VRFGKLTVIDDSMAIGRLKGARKVYCRCDCGNVVLRKMDELERGRSQSCGCLSKKVFNLNRRPAKDYQGQQFGKLTAVKIFEKNRNGKGENVWECQCECGRTKYVTTSNLTLGRTTNCGKCGFVEKKKEPRVKRKPLDRETVCDGCVLYIFRREMFFT
jgi:hypothetical protein